MLYSRKLAFVYFSIGSFATAVFSASFFSRSLAAKSLSLRDEAGVWVMVVVVASELATEGEMEESMLKSP